MESALTDFTFKLYEAVRGGGGNIFMSPYSVSAVLMLTMLGTKGETETQAKQVLGVAGIPDPHQAYSKLHASSIGKSKDGAKLTIANQIFSRLGLNIRDSYRKDSLSYYNGKVKLLDFVGDPEGSRRRINKWVEDQTNNKIRNLIPQVGIDVMSLIVLTNAIYFKGDWDKAFESSKNKYEMFHVSKSESVMVEMMNMEKKNWIAGESQKLDCKMLELLYKWKELSMLFILPNKDDGLSKLESNLSAEHFQELTNAMHTQKVIVSIPKFKLNSSFQLATVLAELGIDDIFSVKADFSAMLKNPPEGTHVSDVIHKAFVEVNEKGTKAAAATAVMSYCALRMDVPMVFRADHPFLFLIREISTGAIFFIGRHLKPSTYHS